MMMPELLGRVSDDAVLSLRPVLPSKVTMRLPRGRDVSKMVLRVLAFFVEHLFQRSAAGSGACGTLKSYVRSPALWSSPREFRYVGAESFKQLDGRLERRPVVPKPPHPPLVGDHPGPIKPTAGFAERREDDGRRYEIRFNQVVNILSDRPPFRSATRLQISRRKALNRPPDLSWNRSPRGQSCRLVQGVCPGYRPPIGARQRVQCLCPGDS